MYVCRFDAVEGRERPCGERPCSESRRSLYLRECLSTTLFLAHKLKMFTGPHTEHGEPRVLFSCTRLGRGWFVKVYKEKRRKKVKEDIQEEDTQNKKRPRAPPSGTLPHDGMCARLGLST